MESNARGKSIKQQYNLFLFNKDFVEQKLHHVFQDLDENQIVRPS